MATSTTMIPPSSATPTFTSRGLVDCGPPCAPEAPASDPRRDGLDATGPHERRDAREGNDEPGSRQRAGAQMSPEVQELGERHDDALERQERHHEGAPHGQAAQPELCSVDREEAPDQQEGAEREKEGEPSQGQRLAHHGRRPPSAPAWPPRCGCRPRGLAGRSERPDGLDDIGDGERLDQHLVGSGRTSRLLLHGVGRDGEDAHARCLDPQAAQVVDAVADEVDDGGVGPVDRQGWPRRRYP